MTTFFKIFAICLCVLSASSAYSAEDADQVGKGDLAENAEPAEKVGKYAKEPGNVLNFDADVIQGERRRPELFIQLGNDRPGLEAIIYGRKNFNDFHVFDRVWRPSYYEVLPPPRKDTKGGGK